MARCRACGAAIEWVRDGAQMVPVDTGSCIPVLPGRGQFACYPESGGVVVGRMVSRKSDRVNARVRWGRTLHWGTCEAGGAWQKGRAVV